MEFVPILIVVSNQNLRLANPIGQLAIEGIGNWQLRDYCTNENSNFCQDYNWR